MTSRTNEELDSLLEMNAELVEALHHRIYGHELGSSKIPNWDHSGFVDPDYARNNVRGVVRSALEQGATDIFMWSDALAPDEPIFVMPGEYWKTINELERVDISLPRIKYEHSLAA